MADKRAYDGSPLWTCHFCGVPKRRRDMHIHGEQNICKACYDNTEGVDRDDLCIAWAVADTPPADQEKLRDRVVWKHIKDFLCYYRMQENRNKFNTAYHKKRILPALFKRRRKFPDTVREPVLQAMANFDLDPRTQIWLAFRDGVFDKRQLRWLAIEVAEQAVQFTDLTSEYPIVHDVLNAVHRFVNDDNMQVLRIPREQVYAVMRSFEDEVFVKMETKLAVEAVSATCYRSSWDAAAVATARTYEALEHVGVSAGVIVSTFADTVREISREAVQSFVLPEVPHWDGLEEV